MHTTSSRIKQHSHSACLTPTLSTCHTLSLSMPPTLTQNSHSAHALTLSHSMPHILRPHASLSHSACLTPTLSTCHTLSLSMPPNLTRNTPPSHSFDCQPSAASTILVIASNHSCQQQHQPIVSRHAPSSISCLRPQNHMLCRPFRQPRRGL